MPDNTVYMIDTSVLLNLLRVPGRDSEHAKIRALFEARLEAGAKFVLPITTLIESGNHIAQCSGDRRAAAGRFVAAVDAARSANPPWTIRDVNWGEQFLSDLIAGDSTDTSLHDHLANATLGTGDLSILVERDHFRRETAFSDVRVWTLDASLLAYA
ncbi:hypothetical protein [Cellulomonas soli]